VRLQQACAAEAPAAAGWPPGGFGGWYGPEVGCLLHMPDGGTLECGRGRFSKGKASRAALQRPCSRCPRCSKVPQSPGLLEVGWNLALGACCTCLVEAQFRLSIGVCAYRRNPAVRLH
jgi:hypothetical protein